MRQASNHVLASLACLVGAGIFVAVWIWLLGSELNRFALLMLVALGYAIPTSRILGVVFGLAGAFREPGWSLRMESLLAGTLNAAFLGGFASMRYFW